MNKSHYLGGLTALLLCSTQATADDSAIAALETKLAAKVQAIQTASQQQLQPDALEQENIKIALIGEELRNSRQTFAEISTKYQLDPAQQRQLLIIVYSGSGAGIEPE